MKRWKGPLRLPWARAGAPLEKYPRGVIIHERYEPAKSRFPTVELPKVVLDLDAEDSPHVRPFSDQDDAQQRAKWGYDPTGDQVISKVTRLRNQMAKDGSRMRHQASKHNSVLAISDYNVLAIALLGGSSVSSSLKDIEPPDEQHRPTSTKHLRENGIPERILAGNANKVIPFMLHRQQLARDKEDKRDPEALKRAIGSCNNLSLLRRLCFRDPSASSEQRGMSSTSVGHIVHALRIMHSQPLEDVLKFINNFTIRQLSDGEGLNAAMSLYGLEVASQLKLLSPIMNYLQVCLSQGFISHGQKSAKKLLLIGRGILAALEGGQGNARGIRPGLFALLTGRSPDSSALQPALFGLNLLRIQEDPEAHRLYIRLLAELGAFRLLWHSWNETQGEVGVAALVRCVDVLSSLWFHAGVDYETVTGDVEEDADLDLRNIDRLDAHCTSAPSTRPPYSFDLKGLVSPDEVKEVFESPDIDQAGRRLKELVSTALSLQAQLKRPR